MSSSKHKACIVQSTLGVIHSLVLITPLRHLFPPLSQLPNKETRSPTHHNPSTHTPSAHNSSSNQQPRTHPPSTNPMTNYNEAPNLPVIGTSRKPTPTDLLNRNLNGLPDPSPAIKLIKTALKKEQLALRMQVDSGIPVSYLRTRIGEEGSDEESELSSCPDTESNTASDDVASVSDSTVAHDEEVGEVRKGGWNMRSRTAVQLHPYKREREVYYEMVGGRRGRKVEG